MPEQRTGTGAYRPAIGLLERLERAMHAAGVVRYTVARDHPFDSRRVATIRPRAT